ncbi:hypothetical protein [Polaromonas sp. C04]|uniref:hypothetical protein n=1 Tax=Polaromonas sp. C04 TaxID=1945857 RepID=UPI00118552B2|nr:hypothetical protein [Polaromonas sp. C04]
MTPRRFTVLVSVTVRFAPAPTIIVLPLPAIVALARGARVILAFAKLSEAPWPEIVTLLIDSSVVSVPVLLLITNPVAVLETTLLNVHCEPLGLKLTVVTVVSPISESTYVFVWLMRIVLLASVYFSTRVAPLPAVPHIDVTTVPSSEVIT